MCPPGEKPLNLTMMTLWFYVKFESNFLNTVQGKGTYSGWLTLEFYTNLSSDFALASSPHYHRVFVRGKWYDFSPAVINRYFNRSTLEEDLEPGLDVLASTLIHAAVTTWPTTNLPSTSVTKVYFVLFCLSSNNWLPNVTLHCVSKRMAVLLYKVRNKIDFDLVTLIYNHIMGFAKGKEPKVHLLFPCLIYGILKEQGLKLYENEHEYSIEKKYTMDYRLHQSSHFDDRDSLLAEIFPAPAPMPTASGSSSVGPDLVPTATPNNPPELVVFRQQVAYYRAVSSALKNNISSLQAVVADTEDKLATTLRQISTLEDAITARSAAHEDPVDTDDLGTLSSSTTH
ncbi:PREDICTED: uncharacterized protein LOC109153488 [Ipomoea nil]|uniref:uncharacterized protein LOC109153488 n=1 Tax=Ipomoea nil TaxID=35883 RepID=UPI000900A995|nr:PREDICTED: uncharacterized protein LOC109153488 [Ipomoea nil]